MEISNYKKIIVLVLVVALAVVTIFSHRSIKRLEDEQTRLKEVIQELQLELENEKEKKSSKIEELEKTKEELKKANNKLSSRATRGGAATKGKYQDFQATFYCPCTKCCGKNAKGITASGTKVKEGRTIAVDPNVIPLGSKVEIEGFGSSYIAEDTGSAVKGNIVDIFVNSHKEAKRLGRQNVRVKVLD